MAREALRAGRLTPRARGLLSVLAFACVGLGVVWTTEAVTATARSVERVPSPTWREEASFTYAVPVLDGTEGFPDGTVLGMGEAGHLVSISPRVLASFRWRLAEPALAPEDARVQVDAVAEPSGGGRAAWSVRETLGRVSMAPDGSLSTDVTLDLPALERAIERATSAAGAPRGDVVVRLEARVDLVADLPGEPERTRSAVFTLPVSYAPPLYVLPPAQDITWSRTHGEPTLLVHESPAGLSGVASSPHAPALAALGVVVLVLLWAERPAAPAGPRQATLDEVRP